MRLNKTLLSLTIAAATVAPAMQATAAPLQISNTVVKAEQVQGANAWLEINLGQFRDNIEQFKSHMDGKTKICAVMKADAYGNGGSPDQDFNSVLLEAIDQLLDTPEVPVPVEVYTDSVAYKYADDRLESLNEPQKQLLRTGPDNMRRIKAKLRELKVLVEERGSN